MKILAVSNQKGGVGKTTLSTHLAYAASDKGLRVLLIDLDTQANASMMFEKKSDEINYLTSSDLFDETITNLPIEKALDNLWIIRAERESLTVILDSKSEELSVCPSKVLQPYSNQFDLCIIDCPPARGLLLMSALSLAQSVISPIDMCKFSIDAFAELLNDMEKVKKAGNNPSLKMLGAIGMKINTRSTTQMQQFSEFKEKYKEIVLPYFFPVREAVQAAINESRPVWTKVRGASHKKTAEEWRKYCDTILAAVIGESNV